MASIQKIAPSLWFNREAEEAAKFYISVFKNSKIGKTSRYGKEGFEVHRMPEGTVMTIEFWLEGLRFMALNGGPVYKFNEAISFVIDCETQEEVDHFWNCLSEGGDEKAQMCGWLKDKFGVSWQVVPVVLGELLSNPDKEKAGKVMQAMLKMKKIEIDVLKQAAK